MNYEIKIFKNAKLLAEQLAKDFQSLSQKFISYKGNFNVALSGGNTPKLFFRELAENYRNKIEWSKINFFWSDERCVPPEDKESNYGMAKTELLDKVPVSKKNIFRVHGEGNPQIESEKYSSAIQKILPNDNGKPIFDLIILGVGEDGHTASIFPQNIELINSDKLCEVSEHPVTKQKRITLTGKVLNSARFIFIAATGETKAKKLKEVFNERKNNASIPVKFIKNESGKLYWYLDREAAKYL